MPSKDDMLAFKRWYACLPCAENAKTDIYTDTTGSPKREERIVVVPNPTTADADDDFGFTTTISTYTDSKNYNPSTDSDA